MSFMDYLTSRFPNIQPTTTSEEVRVNCFNCSDSSGHMYVNVLRGKIHCHKCGKSYRDLVAFIADRDLVPRRQAAKIMADYNMHLTTLGGAELYQKHQSIDDGLMPLALPPGCRPIDDNESRVCIMARQYLRRRGFTLYDIKLYRLHYCVEDRFAGMVVIPVYEKGLLVYYAARAFVPGKHPAKLFPDNTDTQLGKSDVVFNLDIAADSPMIVVTEGPFDAMKVGRSGVAIFGKKLSETQRKKILATSPSEIVVMLDSDAKEDTLATAKVFNGYHGNVSVVILEKGDPGSMSRTAITSLLAKRQKYTPAMAVFKRANIALNKGRPQGGGDPP